MKSSAKFLLLFIIGLSLSSCQPTTKDSRKGILYTSGGKTSEILVVISDGLWQSSVGDSIKAAFQDVKPWFTQPEPSYDIMRINYAAFQDMFPKYRNIEPKQNYEGITDEPNFENALQTYQILTDLYPNNINAIYNSGYIYLVEF